MSTQEALTFWLVPTDVDLENVQAVCDFLIFFAKGKKFIRYLFRK